MSPPRGKNKPVTSIPYTKVQQSIGAIQEGDKLQEQIDAIVEIKNRTKEECDAAISKRRVAQDEFNDSKDDYSDAKRYLYKKIRDKEEKNKIYEEKQNRLQEERENLTKKLQSDLDTLKQIHKQELDQLATTLKANKARRDELQTVSALESQLNREINDAETTLKREKAQQSQQISTALDEYYTLHRRHEAELQAAVEREKQKNRGMTSDSLETTVITMMREINDAKQKLSNDVARVKDIVTHNTELMATNKQLYMERDLLQKEADSVTEKIKGNDAAIRKLVDELKVYDQSFSSQIETSAIAEEMDDKKSEESPNIDEPQKIEEPPTVQAPPPGPDKESQLTRFFETSVDTLCGSIIQILSVIDSAHSSDYQTFHSVFHDFDGRKKELRFLMSKLGNLTSKTDNDTSLPPIGLEEIEGADKEYTQKHLVEPQKQAILQFAEPIGENEFPELIATHFFQ